MSYKPCSLDLLGGRYLCLSRVQEKSLWVFTAAGATPLADRSVKAMQAVLADNPEGKACTTELGRAFSSTA